MGCEAGSSQVCVYGRFISLLVVHAGTDRDDSQAPRSLPLEALIKLGFGEYQTRKPPVEQELKSESKKAESKSFYDRT
jgi:hypothetical protein